MNCCAPSFFSRGDENYILCVKVQHAVNYAVVFAAIALVTGVLAYLALQGHELSAFNALGSIPKEGIYTLMSLGGAVVAARLLHIGYRKCISSGGSIQQTEEEDVYGEFVSPQALESGVVRDFLCMLSGSLSVGQYIMLTHHHSNGEIDFPTYMKEKTGDFEICTFQEQCDSTDLDVYNFENNPVDQHLKNHEYYFTTWENDERKTIYTAKVRFKEPSGFTRIVMKVFDSQKIRTKYFAQEYSSFSEVAVNDLIEP